MRLVISSLCRRNYANPVRYPALVALGLIASLAISGCSTAAREIVQGDTFRHVIATSHATSSSAPMHLYINGDGRPFSTPHTLARDPSPTFPFVLKLMQQDAQPNAMIGRPCYHGLANDSGCQPALWSRQRFSPAVVKGMVPYALVQQIQDKLPTGSVQVVSDFDHDCCWVQAWPRLLRETARRFEAAATLH